MVDFLRRFQQPVLITLTVVVIIAFVILYGGPGTRLDRLGSQHVATIYGRRIQPADYQAVGRGFEVCRTLGMLDLIIPLAQNARTMDEVANNFVWNTLVLRHAAEELGIQPGEEQIAGAIKKLNVFQKNGQYDHERYLQAMQSFLNPRGMTSAHLEELVRDQIRMQTVRDLLSANADPAPDEIEAAYAERHQKVEAAFVRVEAFAYPSTHQQGRPLSAEMLRGMHVHDISQVHDQKALRGPAFASTDPALRTPIPIVDMIFSQPLRRV